MELIIKAFLVGFVVSAPVGPVAALVLRRTLKHGVLLGVFTGLGAAVADLGFAIVAAMGLSAVAQWFLQNQKIISMLGGTILLVAGILALSKSKKEQEKSMHLDHPDLLVSMERESLSWLVYLKAFSGSYLLTLTNVATILGMGTALTMIGFVEGPQKSFLELFWVLGALFLGAMLWWTGLAFGVLWMEKKLPKTWILKVQTLTSWIVIVSGFACFIRGLNL